MNRREWLATATTCGLLAVAGCIEDEGSGTELDPDDVVRQLVEAIDDGDGESIRELVHPESPVSDIVESVDDELRGFVRTVDFEIESLAVDQQGDDAAAVPVTVSATANDVTREETIRFDVRTAADQWRIWGVIEAETVDPGETVEETIHAYYEAVESGLLHTVDELTHPESPMREDIDIGHTLLLAGTTITIEAVDPKTVTADEATVFVAYDMDFFGEQFRISDEATLRRVDGSWVVWTTPQYNG